jgi:hypothetical protein
MPATTETDLIELLTREELEALLPACACDHLRFVSPGCHPSAPTSVAYNRGLLAIFCGACAAPLFAVKIAGRWPPN